MSMDVSAAMIAGAYTDTKTEPTFEDKLRQESVLIPEDIQDIHIQATPADTETGADMDTGVDADTGASSTTSNYGKGKHWKRNLKKKQAGVASAPVPTERTQEQRREQIRPIIDKLTELQMNVSYPAIRELYKQLNHFVKTGEDAKIKIPFPEFSRKIKGELSNAPYIPCWVKLEMD